MKAQLIIEKGQARLLKAIYLKPDAPHRFEVEIPDEAVLESRDWYNDDFSDTAPLSGKPQAQPGSLRAEINTILGELARVRPGTSIGDDHQTLMAAMEARYAARYDSGLHEPHLDILKPDGGKERTVAYGMLDNDQALSVAIQDFKNNWDAYVARWSKWRKERK